MTPYRNEVKILSDLTKDERIQNEIKRLSKIFTGIDNKSKAVIDGLVKRAAYMRVTLEDYELDLDTNGYIELFTQSEKTDPYERERPVARLYNSMNKNYQSIMKQLADFVEKEPPKTETDKFDEFLNGA